MQADLTSASADVAEAAREAGSDPGWRASLETLSTDLPLYSGHRPGSRLQRAPGLLPAGGGVPGRGQQPDAVLHPARCGPGLRDGGRPFGQRPDRRRCRPWLVALAAVFLVALLVALVLAQRRLDVAISTAPGTSRSPPRRPSSSCSGSGPRSRSPRRTPASTTRRPTDPGRSPPSPTRASWRLRARADDELTLLTRDSDPSYQADYRTTAAALAGLLASPGSGAGSAHAFTADQLAKAKSVLSALTRHCTDRSGPTTPRATSPGP